METAPGDISRAPQDNLKRKLRLLPAAVVPLVLAGWHDGAPLHVLCGSSVWMSQDSQVGQSLVTY